MREKGKIKKQHNTNVGTNKKKVLVICHLTGSRCDGQETKTQDTIHFLEDNGFSVDILNYGKLNLFGKIFISLKEIKKHKKIVLMPGGIKALKFYSFLIGKNKDIHYMTIGGWIVDYLKLPKYKSVFKKMKSFKGIYLQNKSTVQLFKDNGFKNVYYVSNYSDKKPISYNDCKKNIEIISQDNVFRFCFFARVCKEKGIFLACEAIKEINEQRKEKVFLDVYGKADSESTLHKLEEYKNCVKYYGTIHGEEVIKTLSSYFALVFPSFYKGEGTPHSLIESFMAGLPPIASDWKYNSEIVDDYETGLLFSSPTKESLKEKILWAIENRNKMIAMRERCFEKSKIYSRDLLLKPFLERIVENE